MKYPVKVPSVGESITTGLLTTWHQQDQSVVQRGDLLFSLDTDKVSSEITAPESGILTILSPADTEVAIGSIVAEILPAAESSEKKPPTSPLPSEENIFPSSDKSLAKSIEQPLDTEHPEKPLPSAPKKENSPTLSKQETVELSKEQPKDSAKVSHKKISPLRRKIAQQLVSAQQEAAILTTFNECDMAALIQLRKEVQPAFQKKYGVKLGFMSFFIKAVVEALQAVPQLNTKIEGEEIITHHYYDIGVAIGSERGLVVPVLREADRHSLAELEEMLFDFANKARHGSLTLNDLQGGVFTISNGGVYGSLLSTPILNRPQSGILGMHTIQERPIALEGKVVIHPMMYLALSYDHRLVDGKEAVTFLLEIKKQIENPLSLFL